MAEEVQEEPKYFAIPRPSADVFNKRTKKHTKLDTIGARLLKEVYPSEADGGGILLFYEGHVFPYKGYPFPEAVLAIHTPKKFIKASAEFIFDNKIIFLFLALVFFPFKKRLLKSFHRAFIVTLMHSPIEAFMLEEYRYCTAVQELRRAGNILAAKREGWVKDLFHKVTDIVSMVFEYDNAWRYRMQDAVTEINKEEFEKNPSKEFMRVINIVTLRERSWHVTRSRQLVIGKAVALFMRLSPVFRSIIKEFVRELNIDKVKMDLADLYYNYVRPDYDTQGLPMEQRLIQRGIIDKAYNDKLKQVQEQQKNAEKK